MRPPDLKGKAEAWIIPLVKERPDYDPAWAGTLAYYLLHCTWSHPFWSYYLISGVHLRPLKGVKAAYKEIPGASHEVMIYSLDPKFIPDPDLLATGEQKPEILSPPDLVHQVGGLNDNQFKEVMHEIVVAIIQGKASPDVDFREYWKRSINSLVTNIINRRIH